MNFGEMISEQELIRLVLQEAREQAEEHLNWLASDEAEHEEDKDIQRSQTAERMSLLDQVLG
jgi:hypothetical protein